jgi:hypothetical protein
MSLDTFLTEPDHRRRMSRRGRRVFAVVFAVVFLIVGMYTVHAWDQAANGVETDAVVLTRDDVKPGVVNLTVRFTTAGGQQATTELTEYSGEHTVGATMRVRYTPDDLSTYQAEEPPFRLPFLIFGGFFLVVAVGQLVYAWVRPERATGPIGAGRATTA